MKYFECVIDGQACVAVENLRHFNMEQIMDSGQCFRIREVPVTTEGIEKSYIVPHGDVFVRVDALKAPHCFIFHCSKLIFETVWIHYFCLDEDYYEVARQVLHEHPDEFIEKAMGYGSGIRILRQDLHEMILSFIISQNNNISRIQKSVEALCVKYGCLYDESPCVGFYRFPHFQDLVHADFSELGLGYRQGYLAELFNQGHEDFGNWLSGIKHADHEEAKKMLLQIKGVGNKVADCICLYGRHDLESYPIDTWMKRIINDIYGGNFDVTPYKNCAGYVQQLQFYYYRSLSGKKFMQSKLLKGQK